MQKKRSSSFIPIIQIALHQRIYLIDVERIKLAGARPKKKEYCHKRIMI